MAQPARKRGRPPDATARRKILRTAMALLDERGLPGITMEGIAAGAGVGKPTIYRYWPNAHAVAMAAFLETADRGELPARTRGAIAALRAHLRAVAVVFASRAGRSTAAMIAAAQSDSELAKVFRNHFILESREKGRAFLQRAVAEGALRRSIDFEATLDLLYAPLYFRLLVGHGALDAAFIDAVLDTALDGLRKRR